jgi:diguanylate cyclase (GGDEF)-like protein/PAS domain S-box-containing protein
MEALQARLSDAEHKLFEIEAKHQALIGQLPAAIYVASPDPDGPTYYVSPQIAAVLGEPPEAFIDNPAMWDEVIHQDDVERAHADWASYIATGQPDTSDYRYVRPNGEIVWIHDRSTKVHDEQGRLLFVQGVMFDITEQKESEFRIHHMAYHDPLTDLSNRSMFEEHLELALARARRDDLSVAVLFLDLDQFKLVNDSLGHAMGDELLVQVAQRLRDATRDTDLVARQGGDEFLVLVGDLERGTGGDDDAVRTAGFVADRIADAFLAPFHLAGIAVHATSSIGISVFPEDARDAQGLMRNADAAMYMNKRMGSARYTLHTVDGEATDRLDSVERLRTAVEEERWELHYQPYVELATGEVAGVEALLRWRDPSGGITRPGEFIPLAEETGLIQSIGEWVLEEACAQAAAWRRSGLDLDVSVNVSPLQLGQPGLAETLSGKLALHGMPPERLILELTESSAMTDPDRIQQRLWELRAIGIRIAMDHFGTGASSLSRLRHLPVEILKIDQSFVRDAPFDADAAAMVISIVDLASRLGLTPLAEAVETQAQRTFLVEHGCTLGQGYFFCKPFPADALLSRFRARELRQLESCRPRLM